MRKTALLASFLAVFTGAFAQTAATKQPSTRPAASTRASESKAAALPTQAQIDSALQRTLGYDPGLSYEVYDIHPSSIPGVVDILVSLNKQQALHVYWSQSTQDAIVGEMIPFGPNPYAAARAKLQAVDGPGRGAASPQILMVGFSDLQCPHCRAAEPVLEKLLVDFPQVRFVFQQFPLPASMHPWALKAAEYADCAARMDKDAFWKYINTIFENQGGIALATADEQLTGFANAVGLDGSKIAACAATPGTEARVNKSVALGQSLEINETPTVFINGRRVRGIATMAYDQLKVLVQFEIDHAGR